MFRFENLVIWQESIHYTNTIYSVIKKFPRTEVFALQSQLRGSSSSIPANIAEGSGSSSDKEFAHFLEKSIKSLYETIAHLQISKDQGYITEDERIRLYNEGEKLVRSEHLEIQ